MEDSKWLSTFFLIPKHGEARGGEGPLPPGRSSVEVAAPGTGRKDLREEQMPSSGSAIC